MDALIAVLARILEALFTKPENIALLVSVAANVALSWFILSMRKEDRADRLAMTAALNTMTDAINKMRLVIAATIGKDDV